MESVEHLARDLDRTNRVAELAECNADDKYASRAVPEAETVDSGSSLSHVIGAPGTYGGSRYR